MAVFQTLGAVIRARRQELDLTQETLAARIGGGVRQSDIWWLERGRVVLPHVGRLQTIASALTQSLAELLARSGWTGAAEVLATAPFNVSQLPPTTLTRASTSVQASLSRPARYKGIAIGERLAAALRQSAEARAQSEQVLRRAQVIGARMLDPVARRRPFAEFKDKATRCDISDAERRSSPVVARRAPSPPT